MFPGQRDARSLSGTVPKFQDGWQVCYGTTAHNTLPHTLQDKPPTMKLLTLRHNVTLDTSSHFAHPVKFCDS